VPAREPAVHRAQILFVAGAKAAASKRLELLTAAAADKPDAVALTYDFARVAGT
jgi:hypothetical protein